MNIAEKIQRAKADYDAVFEAGKKAVGEILKFTDVASTAYRSIVPNGVEPFAKVNKIGGMSYKTRNLIPFPYVQSSGVVNGSTVTIGEDGSISIDITPTKGASFILARWSSGKVFNGTYTMSLGATLPAGSYFDLWDALGNRVNLVSGNQSTRTLTINGTYTELRMWISVDGTYNNNKFYPMLNEGTTALPYEPYFEGLRSASVSELKSEGATALPYKQYKGTIDTFNIPEPIKSLDGYGLGVNSEYYNYIDFDRKVFVQNVYRKVFDGTEYISRGTNGAGVTRFIASTPYTAINVSNVVNVVCNHYKPSTIYETNDYAENRLGASASAIRWVDAELLNGTEEEMKAKLKAWYDEGNPLIVDYALAEPIETDISAYLTDEYIEVEGGGTVTAVNEYGYDAPTNISYLIDTQGG